ncbi:MAG: type II secretion system protein M [Gammaproteobacteria bacterium]|nr:type II secretion system protein M [Gammaproteobacteria bacterium]
MKQWFSRLQRRERYALILGSGLLLAILGYFLMWEPFAAQRASLAKQVAAQRALHDWMEAAARQVRQLRSRKGKVPEQSLLSLIDKSLRQSALNKVNKRIEPKSEQAVRVNFEQVAFNDLILWLARLQNRHGVRANSVAITRRKTPGIVSARLTLVFSVEG